MEVKDSSSAIPAFGGLLDILDSLLISIPVAYYFLVIIGY
jgi:phosphatidate cytidylyltransferase